MHMVSIAEKRKAYCYPGATIKKDKGEALQRPKANCQHYNAGSGDKNAVLLHTLCPSSEVYLFEDRKLISILTTSGH